MPDHAQKSARKAAPVADHDTMPTTDASSRSKPGTTKHREILDAQPDLTVKEAKLRAAEQERDARRLAAEIKQNESDDRFTSRELLDAVEESFGPIDFDPCWHEASEVRPRRYLDVRQGHNGLRTKWSGPLAFMNPPWSNQDQWIRHAHGEWRAGNARTIVCLVPAAIGTVFFHSTLAKDAKVFLIEGRPRFSKKDGSSEPTMVNTMVVVFGATDRQRARFAELVRGAWWVPEDLLLLCGGRTRADSSDAVAYFTATSCSAPRPNGSVITVFCGGPVGQVQPAP